MDPFDKPLAVVDPEIAKLIREETARQAEGLELIASENFVSEAVLEAAGSTLTNKYAEGLPGKRYYGGCEVVDKVEQLAIDRAKALFGAEHANVQPHAGSQANMATYFALLRPGDRILSLSLAQRGPRSGLILSKQAHAKAIDSNVFPGIQGGPLEHIIAAKAVAFGEALKPEFKDYQQRILDNAQALAQGLIAGGLRLVAGGTDTHLMLCDLRPKKLTGKVAEAALQTAHITTNKNMIPGDPEKPFVTSGLRLGTPALTTRGMGPGAMTTGA